MLAIEQEHFTIYGIGEGHYNNARFMGALCFEKYDNENIQSIEKKKLNI